MAGKKRRAASKAASTAKKSASQKDATDSSDKSASVCVAVLSKLIEMASSRRRSAAVLQAFIDQKCWTDSEQMISGGGGGGSTSTSSRAGTLQQQGAEPHVDCYWIILATNIMARLLVLRDNQAKKANEQHWIPYLASLADLMTTILLSDKTKLEKACQHNAATNASRSILCRAIITATIGSFHVVQKYDPNDHIPDESTRKKPHEILESAVATLTRLTFLKGPSTQHGNLDPQSDSDALSPVGSWTTDGLDDSCIQVEELLGSLIKLERQCVKELEAVIADESRLSPSKPPPAKRAARSRRGSSKPSSGQSEVSAAAGSKITEAVKEAVSAFEKLLAAYGTRIDGRVAVKRWASIALVWSQNGEGQAEVLKEIHVLAVNADSSNVMSHSQKSELMYQLMCIACEIGAQCGVRPAVGGLDQYLRSVSPVTGGKSTRTATSQAKSPRMMRRKDIRDLATLSIFTILQNHRKCLEEEARKNPKLDIVNATDCDKDEQLTQHGIILAPQLSTAISNLCSSASSSVSSSSYTDQAQWSKAMAAIASAHVLELVADSSLPLDCRLAKFALSQFSESVRRLDQQSDGTPSGSRVRDVSNSERHDDSSMKELRDRLKKQYGVSEALPEPSAESEHPAGSKRGKAATTTPDACTFAGTFHPQSSFAANSFTDEQALCLLIRGLNGRKQSGSDPASQIIPFLVDVLRRAYDTRTTRTDDELEDEARNRTDSTVGKRRRGTRKGSSRDTGVSRRKTEHGSYLEISKENGTWSRITSFRSFVAIEALGCLQACFTKPKFSSISISRMIQSSPNAHDLKSILRLGDMLEAFLNSTCVRENQTLTSCEKQLWWAHMSMCQVLGRGQSAYDPRMHFDSTVWDSTTRHEVYHSVSSQNEAMGGWPLSMSSAHHAFLAANLSCASDGEMMDPERSVVAGYVGSIVKELGAFDSPEATEDKVSCTSWMSDAETLSYNDARTLLLALNGLSTDEKQTHLDSVVKAALTSIQSVVSDDSKRKIISRNGKATRFFARVLVLCYSMVNSIIAGRELCEWFKTRMGSFSPALPRHSLQSKWHHQQSTFLGLFGEWDSPALPKAINERNAAYVPRKTLDDMRALFENAFSFAFDSAPSDFCYLMFAAWNGLDQLPRGSTDSDDRICSLASMGTNYSLKILQMRNDVCNLYKSVGTMSSPRLKTTLRLMAMQANATIERILIDYLPQDDVMNQDIPVSALSLLCALPGYLSAVISCFSKPGQDYFSVNLSKASGARGARERGYSSDSEIPPLDDDSDLDEVEDYGLEVRESALSRLRDCCSAFGAAPIHPDWLDASCSIRDGLTFDELADFAGMALTALERLAAASFRQYKRRQSLAIAEAMGENTMDQQNFVISVLRHFDPDASSDLPFSREMLEDIGSITKCPIEVLEEFLEDPLDSRVHQVRTSWCPVSGQRQKGYLRDGDRLASDWDFGAGLRVGGEWELLLSTSLPLSCLDIDSATKSDSDSDVALSHRCRQEIERAKAWRLICSSSIENLVPVSAFLRMAVGKIGRAPHPFSVQGNLEDPFDAVPLHASESLPSAVLVTTPTSLKTSVPRTLALLARISIETDSSLKESCQAIASHLVSDTDSFVDLVNLCEVRCGFDSLKYAMTALEATRTKTKESMALVIEQLLSNIEEFGTGHLCANDGNRDLSESVGRLHTFLGLPRLSKVDTITEYAVNVLDILKLAEHTSLGATTEAFPWSREDCCEAAVRDLIRLLCDDSLCNDQSRNVILKGLSAMSSAEARAFADHAVHGRTDLVVIPATISAFNSIDPKRLKSIIQKDLKKGSNSLANVLCMLLFAKGEPPHFEKSKFVHDSLLAILDSWNTVPVGAKKDVIDVFIAYGVRHDTLAQFATKMIQETSKSGETEILGVFFARLCQLASHRPGSLPVTEDTAEGEKVNAEKVNAENRNSISLTNSCSFIQKSGFHAQHWYHCHTCNLTEDKGCCTLCALVCHEGHDVVYSRYSSFFCDCAAENGGSSDRVACKCLSPLPADQINGVRATESKILSSYRKTEVRTTKPKQEMLLTHYLMQSELEDLSLQGMESELSSSVEALFRILEKEFKDWRRVYSDPAELFLQCNKNKPAAVLRRIPHIEMLEGLRGRCSAALELNPLHETSLVPLFNTTGFNGKFSDDSASNAVAIARFSRNGVSRQVLAADSRGRLVVAEPKKLIFLCCPAANVRPMHDTTNRGRHCMPIVGAYSLHFDVVGMELSSDGHLLTVWGNTKACVAVLNQSFDGVKEIVHLLFDLEEGETILKSQWLPGSHNIVVVSCARFVRLYDINQIDPRAKSGSNERRINPAIGYNLGFEASLRDVVAMEVSKDHAEFDSTVQNERLSRIFLLIENGCIHQLNVKVVDGKIECPSHLRFEPSECVSIPTAGIRLRPSLSPYPSGSTSRSLGEGSKLVFLQQSRALLYKCKSSAVVALMLDKKGDVEGSFQLLPHTISAEILGNEDGSFVSGPYLHWTETGVVYRENGAYFRLCCVANTPSGQPRLLSVEFNQRDIKVREIQRESTVLAFEGLSAFSSPIFASGGGEASSGERVFLAGLTSSGSLICFGEDEVDVVPVNKNHSVASVRLLSLSSEELEEAQAFPLTVFERFTDVSGAMVVRCEGFSGLSMDDIKQRLSRDDTSSLSVPRNGCCMSFSIQGQAKVSSQVVSGVRVCIGEGGSDVASAFYVQGRKVHIATAKKWYNIALTKEEIALGVRTGWICVQFIPNSRFTHRSSTLRLEALELYASDIDSCIIPRSYFSNSSVGAGSFELNSTPEYCQPTPLGLSISAVVNFLRLVGTGAAAPISAFAKDVVWRVVEETAIHPDKEMKLNLQSLSRSIECDNNTREREYDYRAMKRCSVCLEKCMQLKSQTTQSENANAAEETQQTWGLIRAIVSDCVETINRITTERPINFLQISGDIQATLASKVSSIVLEGTRHSAGFEALCSDAVDLVLTETAIKVFSDESSQHPKTHSHLNSSIGEYLSSSNESVVTNCCHAISNFFSDRGRDLFRDLEAARIVAYQCDCCASCPIKEVRYTHLDANEGIDLCGECYEKGKRFAETRKMKSEPMAIDGKMIGLTCSAFNLLKPVSITSEITSTTALAMETGDDDLALGMALQLSLGQAPKRADTFESFLGRTFDLLVEVLRSSLTTRIEGNATNEILHLLLDMIKCSRSSSRKTERAKLFVKQVSTGIASILQSDCRSQERNRLAVALGALSELLNDPTRQPQEYKCSAHGIPATKRKCAKKGPNHLRRFWVCGMDKDKRCGYFQWESEKKAPSPFVSYVAEAFFDPTSAGLLHERLCKALEVEYLRDSEISDVGRKKSGTTSPLQKYPPSDVGDEIKEGVFSSREKLSASILEETQSTKKATTGGFLEASLHLITLIADHDTEGIARWLSFLCDLDMCHTSAAIRTLSNKILNSLCGDNDKRSRSIRDLHACQYFIRRIFREAAPIIDAAVTVKDRARLCGSEWNHEAIKIAALGTASLAGTNLLIKEDTIAESDLKRLGRAVEALWATVKQRKDSWRKLCGLQSLPPSFRTSTGSDALESVVQLTKTPPIVGLLWFACASSGGNQMKAVRLIEIAMTSDSTATDGPTPEDVLSSTDWRLTKDDLKAISLCLVRNGAMTELRKAGTQVVSRIFALFSHDDKHIIFKDLVRLAMEDTGSRGRGCNEYFILLQSLSQSLHGQVLPLSTVFQAYRQQLEAIKYDQSNGYWYMLETSPGNAASKKRLIDLSSCEFCCRAPQHGKSHSEPRKSAGEKSAAAKEKKWHRQQVSPFVRHRLKIEEKTSDEFNLYFKLKHRISVSDVFINISDPRGRYVKAIVVYHCPRPISSDISGLKSNEYASRWQKLATVTLSKGATRVSVSLPFPAVAANIRLEFSEFYSRPGEGSRAPDGSVLALCPRCANPVNNAHGVCGRCGDAVLQCKKCRHINYEVNNGFLCSECGFCDFGKISLEVNAGHASNAVAITNDTDFDRAEKMLGFSTYIEEVLRESLREKVQSLATADKATDDDFFGPAFQQAFLGLPPGFVDKDKGPTVPSLVDSLSKQGSVVEAVAHLGSNSGSGSHSLSPADRSERARSLINIARQIRNDSGASGDRRLIARGMNLDSLEDLLGGDDFELSPSRGQASSNPSERVGTDDGSRKSQLESCQKLLMLTREAGKESFALQRRCDAWEALNNGVLVNTTPNVEEYDPSFSPSHCSSCSGVIAYHLLELWTSMFHAAPPEIEVDSSMLKVLLFENTSTQSNGVIECKKRAVISIATKSPTGAEMVLAAMRLRLAASQDRFCTEILGKILEVDGFSHATEYTKLAMEVLSSRSAGNL